MKGLLTILARADLADGSTELRHTHIVIVFAEDSHTHQAVADDGCCVVKYPSRDWNE